MFGHRYWGARYWGQQYWGKTGAAPAVPSVPVVSVRRGRMHRALQALLTDTVSHAAYTGQDGYGSPIFATAVTHPCRIEEKTRRIVTAQGQEAMSRGKLFFDGDVAIGLRDRLTFEDGTRPALQLVYMVRDETGAVNHSEIFFA